MAAYIMQMYENVLQTPIPVKYIDVEVAYVGDGEGTDVYVGAGNNHGEMYRYLFHVSAGSKAAGNHQVIHHLDVSSKVYDLKIVSNSSVPNHLVIRIYCRSGAGELIGVLSEHQMLKLAN
ncbi:hypothetical protein ACN9MH_23180 [Paenibacillus silvae]|uniref:hypothetical protein n=1 Tax=Paenibacillus TaxID=44249 RepID=UPI001C102265|nr:MULTISPECIES: hypothetical protein [Paenibacillus]MBU5355855.1 hypothetical protein [Paenibacillus barcinonensis]MDM5275924.1 hypothetical protein [Paenibacillus silvae]